MIWNYLVEDVYDDFSLIPKSVPPNRLMKHEEIMAYLGYLKAAVKGEVLPASELSGWTFQKYLSARGKEGWEIVQATRLIQTIGKTEEYGPVYWRIIFKKPGT